MNLNHIIRQNLKKNMKNYYLYVFALLFSVALYFSFVTLQYDPAMEETKGSMKGAAAIRSASILLVAMVSIFLLYANNLFIKRRSKEIALFQLIGMTKNSIFRILTAENFILYFSSLILGILTGFSFSKFMMMIVFKITGIETNATLRLSTEALSQTLAVFCAIYLLIMLMNFMFINRQTILSLFQVTSSTEEIGKEGSRIEMIIGILGILLTLFGYLISSKLFQGAFTTTNELFLAMTLILGSVIIGTYLFYKGSVRFIFYLIRKKKDGYLKIHEVLSLSSIMFRMKSNALLLTIITTVSALAIGLLSLSYISYYSAEKMAKNHVAANFSLTNIQDAERFKSQLETHEIPYREKRIDVIRVHANLERIMVTKLSGVNFARVPLAVISDKSVGLHLSSEEAVLTGNSDLLQAFVSWKNTGPIEFEGKQAVIRQKFAGFNQDFIISKYFTTGSPLAIVNESIFERLRNDLDHEIQKESFIYIGIDLHDATQLEKADELFQGLPFSENPAHASQLELSKEQKQRMGLIMFIVGFLGLTFLITSGCILYFKQMDESEEEKPNYTILRKLGFTRGDLLKGIQVKQSFNFGIPLVIGLSHSYFAVQSGWFLFGTELWTPMMIVMLLYTLLYSIFGILSVLYYKKVIKEAL